MQTLLLLSRGLASACAPEPVSALCSEWPLASSCAGRSALDLFAPALCSEWPLASSCAGRSALDPFAPALTEAARAKRAFARCVSRSVQRAAKFILRALDKAIEKKELAKVGQSYDLPKKKGGSKTPSKAAAAAKAKATPKKAAATPKKKAAATPKPPASKGKKRSAAFMSAQERAAASKKAATFELAPPLPAKSSSGWCSIM